ncbi:outer membrane protein assembly factor BamB family protein [Halogeometricum limi]|uniref:Outer membrane protein assembly factor BamB, contains PQQ-like beta-propeller repeat n=1 Tax=Halogeometricum limi TaxID=555875 RepID=A0A1I6GY32_9EURY|nr:PQQ-binding-like beta-propeller repeat protein [Halogeometricum limi]SFR47066.1 Outer membrane protein assembly factor BamB, contains PQQ-like beta-propeller repeat [Halogeometricum limi]
MALPTRRTLLATVGATALSGLAGCSSLSSLTTPEEPAQLEADDIGSSSDPTPGRWAYPNYDVRNTRYARTEPGPSDDPEVRWRHDDAGSGVSLGAATTDRAYVLWRSNGAYELRALSPDDGSVLERSSLEDAPGSPVLADDTLYSTGEGRVYAFDAETLDARWTFDLYAYLREHVHESFLADSRDNFRPTTPAVGNDRVQLTTPFGAHGLSLDGEERFRLWNEHGHGRFVSRAALAEDRLYFTGPDRDGDSLLLVDGRGVYGYGDEADGFLSAPVLSDTHALTTVAGRSNVETAYTLRAQRRTGKTDEHSWSFSGHYTSGAHGRAASVAAADDDRYYVGDTIPVTGGLRATVYAIDRHDGTVAWSRRVEVDSVSSRTRPFAVLTVPTVAGETLYLGYAPTVNSFSNSAGDGAGVLALDRRTGERRWLRPVGFHPRDLRVVGESLYATDWDGNLAVLG